jgi:CBS domain-containing protein
VALAPRPGLGCDGLGAGPGRVLGAVLIALGVWELFATRGGYGGIWIAVVGRFLMGAAVAEEQQANADATLAVLRVRDVMSPEPFTAPAGITVDESLSGYLFQYRFASFPLLRDGVPAGLVMLSRIREVPFPDRSTVRLRVIAYPVDQVPAAAPGDLLTDLLVRMRAGEDGRALVLSDGRLVGIVTASDITRTTQGRSGAAARAGTLGSCDDAWRGEEGLDMRARPEDDEDAAPGAALAAVDRLALDRLVFDILAGGRVTGDCTTGAAGAGRTGSMSVAPCPGARGAGDVAIG